jgi:hypothetical protein
LPLHSAYAGQHCTAKGDGAFGVSITLIQRDVISISIEEAPSFESAVTFSFPGGILKKHEAVLSGLDGKKEQLTGRVDFPGQSCRSPWQAGSTWKQREENDLSGSLQQSGAIWC